MRVQRWVLSTGLILVPTSSQADNVPDQEAIVELGVNGDTIYVR